MTKNSNFPLIILFIEKKDILDWTESGANNFEPEKADVHIIGATPLDGWDYTSMNDYVSLLEDCGITDISCWGQGNLLQKAKGIKNSRLNIAVSAASLHMVERLKQSYGTPYIMGYPIGSLMEKYFKELIKNASLPTRKNVCKHGYQRNPDPGRSH
ncbi:hypothetical protein [Sporofaciens musculi]|uniref:hypothetical protein n=1 Tax=Sporofaciens musculi TaxID=2681861 RepID=UPI002570C2FD|nr:hypothetical protein [Sporofaciens musculi]